MLKKKKSLVTYTIIMCGLIMTVGIACLLFIQNSIVKDDMELQAYEKLSQETRQVRRFLYYDQSKTPSIVTEYYDRDEELENRRFVMSIKIALAGNPNCGKTTLFNALTGSNQFVGNWPGVTVEKKEGKLKWDKEATIMDLPGIYSLSPYTLEEVVARNYLITDRPDAILNIVDGTNIERNLYLSTQIMELGIPVVMAINMMDLVRKSGDQINVDKLSKKLGCPVVEISALKGDGIKEAANKAVELAKKKTLSKPVHE